MQLWQVFPFDFAGYATDWSWLLRVAVIVGVVGTGIGVVVHLVKLVRPARGPVVTGSPPPTGQ